MKMADYIRELSTGDSYSVMAKRAGFENGSNFRRACLDIGLRRIIRDDVVIVEAKPT